MAPNYQDELTAWCSKHLPGWKQTGADKGEARCELHEDKSPSLWVGLKAGRYRCMGCNREGTLAEYADLTNKLPPPASRNPKAETSWIYTDPTGQPLLRVTRSASSSKKKKFYQSRWNSKTKAWENGGVNPTPLFHAQALAASPQGTTWFLVEGEKCAQHLISRGLNATTAPEGARHFDKVDSSYLELLLASGVVILPDYDRPGFEHALQVGRRLREEQDIESKVLILPGLSLKQDVADWLALPRTARQLSDLVPSALTFSEFEKRFDSLCPGFEPERQEDTRPDTVEQPPQEARADVGGWSLPEPIPVREGREAFEPPLWVLPPVLVQMVNRISAAKQVPQGSILGTLLGLGSAICAGRYVARIAPQYNSHSHIWALLSVRSSGGKSEPAATLSPAIAKAEKRHKEDAERYNCANASERANLAKQIEAMEGGSAEDYPGQLFDCKQRLAAIAKRNPVRYLRKDATPQKIGILYARHQVVSIFIAEAADFIANFMGYSGGRDSVAYLTAMLSGHTVEPFGEDRVGREESHCERPVLSMFLACQEKNTVRLLKDETALDRGLCSRLLVFQGESWVGKRRPYDQRPSIQESDLEPWGRLVDTVTRHESERDEDGWIPMHIPVHPEASALYSRIFEVVEKRLGHDSPDLPLNDRDDVTGKVQEVIGRLAVLVHVIWAAHRGIRPTAEPITGASVVYGFALAIWSLRSYFEIAGISMPSVGGQNEALDLWNSLRDHQVTQKGYCTLKEWIRLGPSKWRNANKSLRHLAVLEELGYVQVTEQKNSRGPASKIIQLNPLARGHSPEKVATVATVEQDPMFIELLQAQGLKIPFATVATVSGLATGGENHSPLSSVTEPSLANVVEAALGDWV